MRNFRLLDCWKLGMEIVKQTYKFLEKLPSSENYGLRSQMSRAAISMPSNIAEGCGRNGKKDMGRFFEVAVSSAFELETQLLAGQSIDYFNQKDIDDLLPKIQNFQKKTNSYRLKLLS